MSQKYPGGVINKNPVVPSGPYQNSTASGVWTMDQAAQYVKAGNWPTSGNIDPSLFIENLFSTYLYTGNGSTQTITNGIDLSGKGGLVWMKGRSGATDHALYDTARGATKDLVSNSTAAETTQATGLTAFSGTGFSIGALAKLNTNAATYVSWTFREQAKFFDIVTYTGDGSASPRQIAHSLGSVPGFIVIKRTDTTSDWTVWHRSVTGNAFLQTTDAWQTGFTRITTPDSTTFTVGASIMVNASGGTYVAYLFAHNAGGFGLSGTDNVISCGSYTTVSNAATISLGYEPQLILHKRSDGVGNWEINDNMRGLTTDGSVEARLFPNNSNAESDTNLFGVTATGFTSQQASATYIYIAIRRGPMKVPTSGTQVYEPLTNQPLSGGLWNHNILTDFSFYHWQSGTQNWGVQDRLRGSPDLSFNSTAAENGLIGGNSWDVMNGYKNSNPGAGAYNSWAFRRAPGFLDVVCYTGTGANATRAHNLGAVPQMMIVKKRSGIANWAVYHTALGASGWILLNSSATSSSGSDFWQSTTPTSTNFYTGTNGNVGDSGQTYVAYLFATCAEVSKVGSYTGTGTTQVINCGFTAGSRFVMIKRTDSTGDWYVWDSARGIVAGNDPYVLLNSGATNVTGTDYIDTAATGFEISSTAPAAINANGGSFIFLAIA